MGLFKIGYNRLFLLLLCFGLIVLIFSWIEYLTMNGYIIECFTSSAVQEDSLVRTSHTVDLPLTTSYSCKNFCGPTARCSITGQQCSADIDCPGCQPYTPPLKGTPDNIPGDNDAGKLTVGMTPNYSPLTSGYGTHERVITSNMFSRPSVPNFGVDIWKSTFTDGEKLYNERYKPNKQRYMPNYPKRYSFTGEFIEDGPFASNAPI